MKKKNNQQKKVLFIICEGATDDVTLHRPLTNFINDLNKYIKVEITNGDVAYTKNINSDTCVKYIKKIVDNFREKMFLLPTDIIGIIHFIDTDGAFMNTDNIVSAGYGIKNTFIDDTLLTASKSSTTALFTKKKEVYQKLVSTEKIGTINYYKFFFSRNLEHALYDIPSATLDEKITLSKQFEYTYQNDSDGFKSFLKDVLFDVPNDYNKSWEYIFLDNNSVKRGSNAYLMFDILNKNLK